MRVNVFMRASNDSGREVTLGGRRKSDSIFAHFNTDNAVDSNVALKVRVSGGQVSRFDLTMPDLSNHVEVYINGQRWTGPARPVIQRGPTGEYQQV
jgi:hypothetical protein